MRELSSSWTWFYKGILPAIWFVAAVSTLLQALFRPNDRGQLEQWVFVVICVAGAVFTMWWGRKLKFVFIHDPDLLIKDYRRSVRVPLKDVDWVWQKWRNQRNISLHIQLTKPCLFGSDIVFQPAGRRPWDGEHPLVAELTTLVNRAKD